MRKAIVSGQFYPAEEKELIEQIESCFKSKLGAGDPAKIMRTPSEKSVKALISPHAGYVFSGACASHGFSELLKLKKEELPKTFILLGPNHSGYANSFLSLSLEDFETPLGIIKNNGSLGQELLKKCKNRGLIQDELAHKYEHSIEVQLPFLQYVYKKKEAEFQIVPIIISTSKYEKLVELADSLSTVLKKKERICIIASSDFTHFGANYGFVPFNKNVKENLYALDKNAIDSILKLNPREFHEKAEKTTICGMAGIIILIEIMKNQKAKAELLKYYTSGDINQDYKSAVGYASIIFY